MRLASGALRYEGNYLLYPESQLEQCTRIGARLLLDIWSFTSHLSSLTRSHSYTRRTVFGTRDARSCSGVSRHKKLPAVHMMALMIVAWHVTENLRETSFLIAWSPCMGPLALSRVEDG
jgi:hypothetical protein